MYPFRYFVAAFAAGLWGNVGFAASNDSQLANLSARAAVGTGADVVIAGFVVAEESEQILVRAIGPGLVPYGVPGVLVDPVLTVYDQASQVVASNDNWDPALTSTFQELGAFALAAGSDDAALVLALPPGAYTAVVTGVAGTTGVALVEVYDVSVSTGSRLINMSARALVGTDADILIPGLAIAPGETRRMLVRAVGPGLEEHGVAGFLVDPQVTLVHSDGTVLAFNDNWASDEPHVLAPAFSSAGAFAFAGDDSLDAAMLRDLGPGSYTLQVAGVGHTAGVALVEIYDLTPRGVPPLVTIAALDAAADETGANPASFVLTRTGDLSQFLVVNYTSSGPALNFFDYAFLNGRAALAAGEASALITLAPAPDLETEPVESATLTLGAGLGYTLGGATAASIDITSTAGTLYVANLRPESGAQSSTGYGTATLLLNAAQTQASISLAVSNLSSPQTTAYLRLGPPGQAGAYITGLPVGQSSGVVWTLLPTALYTVADLVTALQTGLLYVGIETADYPGGELRGTFVQGVGSHVFTPPPPPPAAPLAPTTPAEAARFLTQSTFGATQADIDALLTPTTFAEWIDAQIALPATLHLPATLADFAAHPEDGRNMGTEVGPRNRLTAWWGQALHAPDQLRQRVAFALSQILVVSDANATIANNSDGAAGYYDLLVQHAFGNYRELLEDVSRSPVMGAYLSHLRNAQANPLTGALPDENYAREVMQLFSIGLVQLQPDGTLQLDEDGLPAATYDQATITETAKVFTGWSFYHASPTPLLFRRGPREFLQPMIQYPDFHDTGAKTIVGGVVLPAGQTGEQDLAATLDALCQHPNTGPFVARRLIQRLVTSNPSPAYVYRVAQVFADNGFGVRGDLGAVVRAILLDYEARSLVVAVNAGFGKLKEPVLRLSALLRALDATVAEDRFEITNTDATLGQGPLQAPTVFNFFAPDYVLPGALAAAGLYAPEFQIHTDTYAIAVPNELRRFIFNAPNGITLTLTELLALVATPDQLVDRLDLLLCAGQLSDTARDRIILALNQLPGGVSATERVRTAIYLVANCPDGATQR